MRTKEEILEGLKNNSHLTMPWQMALVEILCDIRDEDYIEYENEELPPDNYDSIRHKYN